ncbi:hypothetical protein PRZ48_009002 [Zasmidium cellare]|uniref:Uncharacterized protein n=1 Tax=Zasmidium cellare TaxID=395010 RepID=A0ABR0EH41_ZASCE|nr:hypothetical protein PRZ48_009002 [Zasmidium cellare]
MSSTAGDEPFRFLDLAAELRNEVYGHLITIDEVDIHAACAQNKDGELRWTFGSDKEDTELQPLFAMRKTSKQVCGEIDDVFGKIAKVAVFNSSDYRYPLAGTAQIHAPASLLRGVRDMTLSTTFRIVQYTGAAHCSAFPTEAIVHVDTSKGNAPGAVDWDHCFGQPDEHMRGGAPLTHRAFCNAHKQVTEEVIRQALERGASSFEIITTGLSALLPGVWSMPPTGDVKYYVDKHKIAKELVGWANGYFKHAEEIIKDDKDNEDEDEAGWEIQAHDKDRLRKFCVAIGLDKDAKAKNTKLSTRGPRRAHLSIFKQ